MPLSTELEVEEDALLVCAQDPSLMETAWLYGPVKSVKPGSSKTIFFAIVILETELTADVNLVSSVAAKETVDALEEETEKNLSFSMDVKAVLPTAELAFKNPIPEIAFSFFVCLALWIDFFGSISAATIEVTSSETLNPEPLLLTKLR